MEFAAHSVSRPISADIRAAASTAAIRPDGGVSATSTGSEAADSTTAVAGTTRVLKPYGVAMLPSTDQQATRNPDTRDRPGPDISRADPQSVTRAQSLTPGQQEPVIAGYSGPPASDTATQPGWAAPRIPGQGAAQTAPES